MQARLWRRIGAVFVAWRLWLFGLAIFSDEIVGYEPSFPYSKELLASFGWPRWIFSWVGFDGVHYLTIAMKGYEGTALIQAFFPIYPLLVKIVALLPAVDTLLAALVVSNLAAIGVLITFWKLIRLDWSEAVSKWMWLSFLFFPTTFFLVAGYSESLFLFFVLQAFYQARQKRWTIASLMAVFASATRLVGIFLIPALLFEMLIQFRPQIAAYPPIKRLKAVMYRVLPEITTILRQQWREVLLVLFGSMGLTAYMWYLYLTFKDPLFFLHVQEEFGGGRSEELVIYPQVVWRSMKILLTADSTRWIYLTYMQEFLAGVGGLLGLLWAVKHIRWSYVIFSLGAFLLPPLTGTFSSMPRYVLVCFPLMMLLGLGLEKLPKWGRIGVIGGLLILQSINAVLFIQGHWVA